MTKVRNVLAISVSLIMSSFVISSFACSSQPGGGPPTGQIIVEQSGGAAALIAQCADRAYITQTADYIVEGTVVKVESQWNEARTSIYTYTYLRIDSYVKGAPFAQNEMQIVTPGGTVGDITQVVEDQPIFHQGKKVRIYLEEVNGQYVILCGPNGVEEM